MIDAIHLDPRLEKCLEALRKGGRRACLAADRVEAIAAALETEDTRFDQICAFTRYGEARIKGCRKFDLGAGYRLVTLKKDNDLFLLFAGTHDECTRWIENNRDRLFPETLISRSRTIQRNIRKMDMCPKDQAEADHAAEEDGLLQLTETDLRLIFSALVQGKQAPSEPVRPNPESTHHTKGDLHDHRHPFCSSGRQ
ncbi:hypothetical protein LJC71_00995 [Desulfosarcina sp. OttesenSCG-928-A07]|nr:hypothetical protein [Desulfosarcina sp. OttesenSCG-928-G17]MDL2328317.1 hypothetical protein [Desulfosarcina sp. OttesenSCG-928-A07]